MTASLATAFAAASMSLLRGGSIWSAARLAPSQSMDSSDVFH